jgi:hypothetical protein
MSARRRYNRRTVSDSEVLRRARVRQLFETLLSEELTETGVLIFYRWLEKYHPELLARKEQGDPYEHLRVELEGLYKLWGKGTNDGTETRNPCSR